MKLPSLLSVFAFSFILISGSVCARGQGDAVDAPPAPVQVVPVRTVGKAKVFFNKGLNHSRADVFVYIEGSAKEQIAKKPVLYMYASYAVPGPKTIEPQFVTLAISSISPRIKYYDDHKLEITADGKRVVEADMSMDFLTYRDGGGAHEHMKLKELSYADFRKIAAARRVTMRIGGTKVELSAEALQGIKDLNETVER